MNNILSRIREYNNPAARLQCNINQPTFYPKHAKSLIIPVLQYENLFGSNKQKEIN